MGAGWQAERNDLNHDWMQNKLLLHLGGWLSSWGKKSASGPYLEIHGFCRPQFGRVRALIEQLPVSMSPRTLFDEEPLSRCDSDTKIWLGDLIHGLWLAKNNIPQLKETALSALDSAEDTLSQIEEFGLDKVDRKSVQAFWDACSLLSSTISKFPHKVLIP